MLGLQPTNWYKLKLGMLSQALILLPFRQLAFKINSTIPQFYDSAIQTIQTIQTILQNNFSHLDHFGYIRRK